MMDRLYWTLTTPLLPDRKRSESEIRIWFNLRAAAERNRCNNFQSYDQLTHAIKKAKRIYKETCSCKAGNAEEGANEKPT